MYDNTEDPQLPSPGPTSYDDVIDTGNAEQHSDKQICQAWRRCFFPGPEAALEEPSHEQPERQEEQAENSNHPEDLAMIAPRFYGITHARCLS